MRMAVVEPLRSRKLAKVGERPLPAELVAGGDRGNWIVGMPFVPKPPTPYEFLVGDTGGWKPCWGILGVVEDCATDVRRRPLKGCNACCVSRVDGGAALAEALPGPRRTQA
ncbi:BZ3500_MvSof-1268-A1-R1_Chr1-3g02371 [Microbotryum saponariae]|uniref:BZ3500_MvSof-1268-A1-R1_Chr1-3g02371 protein n=1 Tax=Microbotryum saponariae TaxID=289078 RepID=A0A2X0KH10_9BASI|nr:BZ3500_MvSof-1268-A1-R1_Chr1-3g02371 [Microbotryum saponariae]SCZ96136.1 BZ3501_MvSof-1269-A2-R1_Chr1-3g01974 [Microbotryum saponariae]